MNISDELKLVGAPSELIYKVLSLSKERDQLRYERRLLGAARVLLDQVAEIGSGSTIMTDQLCKAARDVAQRIVDEIGHPATDEPALGPDLRKQIEDQRHEIESLQAENAKLKQLLTEAEDAVQRFREEHDRACVTIAEMHKAAVGEVRGPTRGLVEDVTDVRERGLANKEALRRAQRRITELEFSQEEMRRLNNFFIERMPKALGSDETPVTTAINLLSLVHDAAPTIISLVKEMVSSTMKALEQAGFEWDGTRWTISEKRAEEDQDLYDEENPFAYDDGDDR